MPPRLNPIALTLRQLRHACHMTQRELAKGMGVSLSYLSTVESGQRAPTLHIITKAAEVMGIPPAVFFWPPQAAPDVSTDERRLLHRLRLAISEYAASLPHLRYTPPEE